MRLIVISLLATIAIASMIWSFGGIPENPFASLPTVEPANNFALILDLERYDDPDYGFSVAVPAGWSRIVSAQPEDSEVDFLSDELEPGYAVGFESPRSGMSDRFADYILIELLPGNEFGLFDTTEAHQHYIHSEQTRFAYDRLDIDSALDDAIDVDLVIFQRGVQAFGYTLAFYAIGEPANEQLLFEAFQIMLRTFEQNEEPFVVI